MLKQVIGLAQLKRNLAEIEEIGWQLEMMVT